MRPLRALGFVDRLIAPWIETAQRSASLRLFDQYTQAGLFPVAYTVGTDFMVAKRVPAEKFIRWDSWS